MLLLFCQVLTLCRPVDSRLEHVDFDSLLQCLSIGKLLQVFASLLLERRVIFIADKLRYSAAPCCGDIQNTVGPTSAFHTDPGPVSSICVYFGLNKLWRLNGHVRFICTAQYHLLCLTGLYRQTKLQFLTQLKLLNIKISGYY